MRSFLLIMVTMATIMPALGQKVVPRDVLEAAVTEVIRPGMATFSREAKALEQAMAKLCVAPSMITKAAADRQFSHAATAFGQIEFIRIGPLMEDNRADRLLFWPDRRGIGLRQVQAILAEADIGATQMDNLRSRSVAVQGFGALEFVLFGTEAETLVTTDGTFRCAYGHAVSANISAMAADLVAGWERADGIASHLMRPQPGYNDYRTETEAMEQIVGLVSHGLEALRDARIKPFLASNGKTAKPKQALFWRAGLTMAMIRANVDGLQRMVQFSGVARAVDEPNKGLDGSIAFEFGNARRALDLVTLPVDQAVEDEKQARALDYLALVTGSLQAMVGEQLAAVLGLSVGFSSLDGD